MINDFNENFLREASRTDEKIFLESRQPVGGGITFLPVSTFPSWRKEGTETNVNPKLDAPPRPYYIICIHSYCFISTTGASNRVTDSGRFTNHDWSLPHNYISINPVPCLPASRHLEIGTPFLPGCSQPQQATPGWCLANSSNEFTPLWT